MNDKSGLPELPEGVEIKPVVGYEGSYSVTSDGRVWSHPRVVVDRNGMRKPLGGKWLGRTADRGGYYTVGLCILSCPRTYNVHILVAAAFLGPKPEGHEVDHIDRVRTNDSPGNLRYVTRSENQMNKPAKGYYWHKRAGKWAAQMVFGGRHFYLGLHDDEASARGAFLKKREEVGLPESPFPGGSCICVTPQPNEILI